MTLATFGISGLLAWLHFEAIGRLVVPAVSVWAAWYAAVLLAFSVQARRARDPAMDAAALVLALSFAAAHLVWNASALPIAAQSLRHIVVAVALFGIAFGWRRSVIVWAGALHLVIVGLGAAAEFGFAFQGRRPATFLAWSYPDIAAGLQHASLLVLSFGIREREGASLGDHPRYGLAREFARVARLAMPRGARKGA